jgi:hypothetical protein
MKDADAVDVLDSRGKLQEDAFDEGLVIFVCLAPNDVAEKVATTMKVGDHVEKRTLVEFSDSMMEAEDVWVVGLTC